MSQIIHTHVDQHRRNLLKGLGAAALATAMPGRLFAAGVGPTAVVIGGGIAGLSAAWELLKAGFQVAIFEKEKFTGGRMVELQMGPLYKFTHAQAVADFSTDMLSLAAELGIEHELRGDGYSGNDLSKLSPATMAKLPLLESDMVVCAVEGKYLDKLIQGMTPKQEALAKNVYFSKEAIVYWMLDDKHAPKEEMGGYYYPDHPDPVKARTTGWTATPGNPGLNHPPSVSFVLSRRHTPEWQNSDTALEEFCWPMIKQLYPPIEKSHVVDIVDYTCDDLCYMPVGYVHRVADVLREQRKQKRGLYFAGEYVAGAHTGAACASGLMVAGEIAKQWT